MTAAGASVEVWLFPLISSPRGKETNTNTQNGAKRTLKNQTGPSQSERIVTELAVPSRPARGLPRARRVSGRSGGQGAGLSQGGSASSLPARHAPAAGTRSGHRAEQRQFRRSALCTQTPHTRLPGWRQPPRQTQPRGGMRRTPARPPRPPREGRGGNDFSLVVLAAALCDERPVPPASPCHMLQEAGALGGVAPELLIND